jgi:hypothetical protein
LLKKLVSHEGNGREIVDDGLEHRNRIPNVHPFHPAEARSQSRIQVLMPSKQQIPE